jgi:hypothetical protein
LVPREKDSFIPERSPVSGSSAQLSYLTLSRSYRSSAPPAIHTLGSSPKAAILRPPRRLSSHSDPRKLFYRTGRLDKIEIMAYADVYSQSQHGNAFRFVPFRISLEGACVFIRVVRSTVLPSPGQALLRTLVPILDVDFQFSRGSKWSRLRSLT